MIGRGLRLSPSTGQRDCLVVELIPDATGVGLFCTPTLFGLDPSTVIRGACLPFLASIPPLPLTHLHSLP